MIHESWFIDTKDIGTFGSNVLELIIDRGIKELDSLRIPPGLSLFYDNPVLVFWMNATRTLMLKMMFPFHL